MMKRLRKGDVSLGNVEKYTNTEFAQYFKREFENAVVAIKSEKK